MNRSPFWRLRLRFIVISMSLLLLFLVIVCVAVFSAMSHSLTQRSETVLDYTADLIRTGHYVKSGTTVKPSTPPAADDSGVSAGFNSTPEAENLRKQDWLLRHGDVHLDAILLEHVVSIYVDADGKILRILQDGVTDSDYADSVGTTLKDFLGESPKGEGTVKLDGSSFRYKCYTVDKQSLCLMVNCDGDTASINQLLLILGSIGAVAIILLLCLCYYLSGRAIKPLEESWKQQQQFVHDASHELKTPLAVISTNIEAIRGCPDDTIAQQDKWLSYIAEEAADMRILVNDMLTLAKGDTPARGEKVTVTFSLSDTVEEAGLLMEANALDAGIMLETEVEENVNFIGNPDDIKRVLLILLDNALKNTFEGGRIDLKLSRSHGDLLITCRNTGRGIPASELQNIFRRFYRVDPSRARLTGGSGLGLSIAERIVEGYKGKIWAESEEGEWALFCVKLPAIKE
ncbi:MAG: HAMP domain-containing histidine kinase [Clostridia bacterium]|nr:HAMP domain-containing histidine kinase [Clostridia bacterium]